MHEEYHTNHEIETSSDRSFGLTVGIILGGIGGYRCWGHQDLDSIGVTIFAIAVPLILLGLIYPKALALLNRAWTKLGFLMFKVVNPIVMFLVYVTIFVPIGLIMRFSGKDPLRIKLDSNASTYWIVRNPAGPKPESMKNQF